MKQLQTLALAVLALLALDAQAGTTSYFIYDEAGHVIGEYDANGNAIQEHVYLGDRPVAVAHKDGSNNLEVDNVTTDQLGTPRTVTSPSQAVLWTWNSDPFGNGSPTGSLTYNLRFPGQYADAETGLSYNNERDYDFVTGRYVESDQIGLGGGVNTYAYVHGNPVAFEDPKGSDGYAYNYYPEGTNTPDNADGWPICDGDGNIIATTVPDLSPCVVDCIRAHENVHVRDLKSHGSPCLNKPHGVIPGFANDYDNLNSEVSGYLAAIQCLESKLANKPCDKCKDAIKSKLQKEKDGLDNAYNALNGKWYYKH